MAADHAGAFSQRSAAAMKLQCVFRASTVRRSINEAAANTAIVATAAFGELIGRNDIRYLLEDLSAQRRRLLEKIETLEHNMYYAKASRQKEIRKLGKAGRKKLREIDEQIAILKAPKPSGSEGQFKGLERSAWQMNDLLKEVNVDTKQSAPKSRQPAAAAAAAAALAPVQATAAPASGAAAETSEEAGGPLAVEVSVATAAPDAVPSLAVEVLVLVGDEGTSADEHLKAEVEAGGPNGENGASATKSAHADKAAGSGKAAEAGAATAPAKARAKANGHGGGHGGSAEAVDDDENEGLEIPLVDPMEAMVFWNTVASVWRDLPSEIERRAEIEEALGPPPPHVCLALRVGHAASAPAAAAPAMAPNLRSNLAPGLAPSLDGAAPAPAASLDVPYRVSLSRPGSARPGSARATTAAPAPRVVASLSLRHSLGAPVGTNAAPASTSLASRCSSRVSSRLDSRQQTPGSPLHSPRFRPTSRSSRLSGDVVSFSKDEKPGAPRGPSRAAAGGGSGAPPSTGSSARQLSSERAMLSSIDRGGSRGSGRDNQPEVVDDAVLAAHSKLMEAELGLDVKSRYDLGGGLP